MAVLSNIYHAWSVADLVEMRDNALEDLKLRRGLVSVSASDASTTYETEGAARQAYKDAVNALHFKDPTTYPDKIIGNAVTRISTARAVQQ